MITPSVEGYVLNACNEEPLIGVEVLIKLEAGLLNPADWQPRVIREVTVYTDKAGFYKQPPGIGMPKGIFFPNTYPKVFPKSDGYAMSSLLHTRRSGNHYIAYLLPEAEQSYEFMQMQWGATMYSVPPGMDARNVSEIFQEFLRYAHNYTVASRIAKTSKDYKFLELFCLRAKQTYEKFSESDHVSMDKYIKAQHEYLSRLHPPGLPIDICINRSEEASTSITFLTKEQMSYVFHSPECGDIKDIFTQQAGRTHLE